MKKTIQAIVLILGAAVLLAPFAVTWSGLLEVLSEPEEALELLSSLTALMAVSFIFLDIVTGSFRPLLARVFKAAPLQRAHTVFGIVGLSFAVTHLALLIPRMLDHYSEANRAEFWLGPIALALVIVTLGTALMMKTFSGSWRIVHLVNYAIFAIVIVHGLLVGEDRSTVAMRAVFFLFAAVAAAGICYRAFATDWRRSLFKAKRGETK